MSQGHDWSANQINPLWGQTGGHYPRDFELENFEAIFAFFLIPIYDLVQISNVLQNLETVFLSLLI